MKIESLMITVVEKYECNVMKSIVLVDDEREKIHIECIIECSKKLLNECPCGLHFEIAFFSYVLGTRLITWDPAFVSVA